MTRPAVILSALFVAAIVAANWLTNRYGFWPVGFGYEATAGTYAAGLTFTLRDAIQDRAGRLATIGLIAVGAAVTYLVSPALAVASGVAFLVAELADFAVYTPLRGRSWDVAVWASFLVGAVVDSVLFLHLAFGSGAVTRDAVLGQVIGKGWATLAAWGVLRSLR
jgi:uncharacterized PurR-regulated membrane protein YhhQ (DUF165 family)